MAVAAATVAAAAAAAIAGGGRAVVEPMAQRIAHGQLHATGTWRKEWCPLRGRDIVAAKEQRHRVRLRAATAAMC